MNARVRSRACSSSATGLRERCAISLAIDVGCEICAARQSSANFFPLVQPKYSINLAQFCSSRSNWSDFRAPSAFNRVSFWGRSFSCVNALVSSDLLRDLDTKGLPGRDVEAQRLVERLVVSFLGHVLADERPGILGRGLTIRPDPRPKGGPTVIRLLFALKGDEV
jgi:hypothetical protein